MVPGLNDADCRLVELRYRQLMSEASHHPLAADVGTTHGDTRLRLARMWQQLGTLLVRTGQRLHCVQAATRERLGGRRVTYG